MQVGGFAYKQYNCNDILAKHKGIVNVASGTH